MLTVILTGGGSRRMGRDKAMLPCGDSTLLQSLIDRYSTLGPVAVSVNHPGRFPFHGALELPDRFPDMGPLNGLVSGFAGTAAEELFLTATDLPFGDPELVLRLSALRREAGAAACVLRRGVKGAEPLFAIYGRDCAAPARELLEQQRKSFQRLYGLVPVRWAEPEELPEFDLEQILMNVNTEEDFEAWQRRL